MTQYNKTGFSYKLENVIRDNVFNVDVTEDYLFIFQSNNNKTANIAHTTPGVRNCNYNLSTPLRYRCTIYMFDSVIYYLDRTNSR